MYESTQNRVHPSTTQQRQRDESDDQQLATHINTLRPYEMLSYIDGSIHRT